MARLEAGKSTMTKRSPIVAAERRSKSTMIDVEFRLSRATLEIIEALAKQGILGETREEVTLYILRSYMFEHARPLIVERQKQRPKPRKRK